MGQNQNFSHHECHVLRSCEGAVENKDAAMPTERRDGLFKFN